MAATAQSVNHGLVLTTGESADGLLVQSVGGGGGSGGAGDAKAKTGADKSVTIGIGLGGTAKGGGSGANTTATNTGAVITLGDGANAMVAQSIGGGGGRGGGAAASTDGKSIQIGVNVGGNGGSGGDVWYTGTVDVQNSGTLVTFGADAGAILAQSIGGGGGAGGKSGTSLGSSKSDNTGGNGVASAVQSTLGMIEQNYAAKGVDAISDYNNLAAAVAIVNDLLGNGTLRAQLGDSDPGNSLDSTAGSGGETKDDNNAKSISLNVGVGGKAGGGGAGGYMYVANSGSVATMGKMADAIVAQSIGGGGGKGGAASTVTSADYSGSVAVGGTGGSGGNGGEPAITNSGQVITVGALSAGIVAQSVGGGGGIGGASATTASSASTQLGVDSKTYLLAVSVGGNGGKNGIGEGALVSSSGAIETRGHDSIGIIAQSIAGGGGIVKTLATDLDDAGGSATGKSSKDYTLDFKFGGKGGATGNSGAAIVTTTRGGSISTRGDNSHGILAQSISGGGGLALGGKPNGSSATDFFGSGTMTGSVNTGIDPNPDNNMGVQVAVGDNIATSGQGAVGLFSQSIGGGGGIAGDIGWTAQLTTMTRGSNHVGSGGDMQIGVAAGAGITTTGSNAPGVIAQTIGGGGGWIANKQGAFIGSAGGSGVGGRIAIDVQGRRRRAGSGLDGHLRAERRRQFERRLRRRPHHRHHGRQRDQHPGFGLRRQRLRPRGRRDPYRSRQLSGPGGLQRQLNRQLRDHRHPRHVGCRLCAVHRKRLHADRQLRKDQRQQPGFRQHRKSRRRNPRLGQHSQHRRRYSD